MKSFGTYHVWYWRWGILSLLITFHFSLLTSCTRDAYEKGEGAYSLMRGDFAEANVNSNCEITSITTDDGETLPLTILCRRHNGSQVPIPSIVACYIIIR